MLRPQLNQVRDISFWHNQPLVDNCYMYEIVPFPLLISFVYTSFSPHDLKEYFKILCISLTFYLINGNLDVQSLQIKFSTDLSSFWLLLTVSFTNLVEIVIAPLSSKRILTSFLKPIHHFVQLSPPPLSPTYIEHLCGRYSFKVVNIH